MATTSVLSVVKKILPLLLLIACLIVFFATGAHRYVSFQKLQSYHEQLTDWKNAHYALAALLFILIYIAAVAVSIPGATVFTLSGGFLFGLWWGTLYVLIGATIGSVVIFLAAKTAAGTIFKPRSGTRAASTLNKLRQGFQNNAFSYLLFLRLLPIFPFWLVNIAAALMYVSLSTFVIATFVGIIPGSFIYVSVGHGLNALFSAGRAPDLHVLFEPHILLPLVGLAALSLLPVGYKLWQRRKRRDKEIY